MAEAFGITASTIGIATAAIKSVQFLSRTIDNLRDVPDTVRSLREDLRAVEPILHQMNTFLQSKEQQIVLNNEIKFAIDNCDRACTEFQALLARWMKRSTKEKTFWIERWRVGLFGQERIKTFRGQLNDCKSTLSVALSTASIITMTRQNTAMKDMKDMMLKGNETALEQKITQAQSNSTEIENDMRQLMARNSAQLSEETEQNKQDLLQEIQQQQASNDVLRRMCEEALSRTVHERTGQKIKGVKATNHSSALAGFINTSGEELKIDQDISDVTADSHSIAVAGVINNLNFADLRSF